MSNKIYITPNGASGLRSELKYLWKEKQIHDRLVDVLTSSFEEVWKISENNNCDLRTAALMKGIKKVAAAKLTRGRFP